jgi:hypothetical protein
MSASTPSRAPPQPIPIFRTNDTSLKIEIWPFHAGAGRHVDLHRQRYRQRHPFLINWRCEVAEGKKLHMMALNADGQLRYPAVTATQARRELLPPVRVLWHSATATHSETLLRSTEKQSFVSAVAVVCRVPPGARAWGRVNCDRFAPCCSQVDTFSENHQGIPEYLSRCLAHWFYPHKFWILNRRPQRPQRSFSPFSPDFSCSKS